MPTNPSREQLTNVGMVCWTGVAILLQLLLMQESWSRYAAGARTRRTIAIEERLHRRVQAEMDQAAGSAAHCGRGTRTRMLAMRMVDHLTAANEIEAAARWAGVLEAAGGPCGNGTRASRPEAHR